jgi:putative flippase GtrA
MLTFLRAQTASLAASLVDFAVTFLLVSFLGAWYVVGSMTGTILGGLCNFMIGRSWVFKSKSDRMTVQMIRYLIVWMGYLLIVTLGIYGLTRFAELNYIVSKLIMTGLVGTPYNYLLQKKFIFLSKQPLQSNENQVSDDEL